MSEHDKPPDGGPRGQEEDGAPASSPRRGHPLRRASDFGITLVVDDEPDAVELLCRILSSQRLRTVSAFSGAQCVEIARSQPVDLILLDVSMPGMNGLEVCEQLFKDEKTSGIPVMLITARDDHETRVAGMKLGVSEFLAKPYNKTELLERVRGQLQGRALARQMDETISRGPEE
jgi:DNA-binding response OmpR family regulator